MRAIVAVDENWNIGYKNNLLVHSRKDMDHFVNITTGNSVIMGRKTWESIPNPPLANRTNIVLSTDVEYRADGAKVLHSMDECLQYIENDSNAIVIGGERIYKSFFPYMDTVYVTKYHCEKEADVSFPNLDHLPEWQCIEVSEPYLEGEMEMEFLRYDRIRQK